MFHGAAELAADCARQRRPELLTPADPNLLQALDQQRCEFQPRPTQELIAGRGHGPKWPLRSERRQRRRRRSPRRRGTAEIIDDQTDWQNLMTIIPKEALGALLTQATRVRESAILAPLTRTGSSLFPGAGSHSQSQCQGLRSRPLIGRRCCTRPCGAIPTWNASFLSGIPGEFTHCCLDLAAGRRSEAPSLASGGNFTPTAHVRLSWST